MTLSESWQPLDIDTPDAVPLPRPGADVHVVAMVATAAARRDGWAARAAVEVARGWGAEGARVLLCDLDLETPGLHDAAGLDNLEGISDALLFGTSFQRLAQPLSDGLYIATAGTAVPDGEALRTHPRWRDFAAGFTEAGAVMALYLPVDAPGADALLALCHAAVLLGGKDEVESVALPGRIPLLAVAGPSASELGDGSPAEADPLFAMEVEVDPLQEGGGFPPLEAEAGSTPDIPLAESLDALDLMDPVAPGDDAPWPAGEPEDARVPGTDVPADPRDAEDPPVLASPAFPGEVRQEETTTRPAPMARLDTPPSELPRRREPAARPPRRRKKEGGKRGTGAVVLVVLILAVLTVLVAGWLGIVEIPGITPSSATGVEEAGAAVPSSGTSAEAPAVPTVAAPGGGAAIGPESPVAAYVLALGSYSSHDSAQARARVLADALPDIPFLVAPVEVQGTPFYRLLAGGAPDTAALRVVQSQLSRTAPGADDWIMRPAGLGFLLGSHASLALAERQVGALSELGIPVHVLLYEDGAGAMEYRVYAGAYGTPGEARYMARLLEANNIQNATLTERKGVRPE